MQTIGKTPSMQLLSCLAANDEVGLLSIEKSMTMQTAVDGIKLGKLERCIGDASALTVICYLLNRFNGNFNVGKSISPNQSAIIASDIVEKYPYETLEDIVLMLKMVRQGSIGDGKDYKVDGQNILAKWMPEYLDKKYQEVERINSQAKAELNSTETGNAVEQYYAKIRRQKQEKNQMEAARQNIDEMVRSMDRQMLEDTITDWSKKPEMTPCMDYLKQQRRKVK
jgi:hypothetical protein